jgi:hypothetical protein
MNVHEYQAKELLAKHGIAVPAGHAALSVGEAVEAAKKLPGPLYVVKAQIHAGGRGKGKFKELGPDASTSPTASTSPRNTTSRCWSTARRAASPSSFRPRAGWTSRPWRMTRPS